MPDADGARSFVRVSVQPSTSDADLAALEAALVSVLRQRQTIADRQQ